MFYKVNLYCFVDTGLDINNTLVGTIIVKKGLFSVIEIMTKHKFPCDLTKYSSQELFIKKNELSVDNIVTLDDVKSYVENFDLEKFDNILKSYNYHNIAIKDQKKIKKYLKQRR